MIEIGHNEKAIVYSWITSDVKDAGLVVDELLTTIAVATKFGSRLGNNVYEQFDNSRQLVIEYQQMQSSV